MINDVINCLMDHRSIRKFTYQPVSEDVLLDANPVDTGLAKNNGTI